MWNTGWTLPRTIMEITITISNGHLHGMIVLFFEEYVEIGFTSEAVTWQGIPGQGKYSAGLIKKSGEEEIMIKKLIQKNRSYRRFKKGVKIDKSTLTDLIGCARLSASASNLQPLKYILSFTPEKNNKIFAHTKWAGYLRDWDGPAEDERPSAYIIMCGDREIATTFGCDHGIAAQSILLMAVEKGLGGCLLGALNREGLRADLGIPDRYEILLVVALGEPTEKVVVENAGDGNIKYYRDKDDVHHVPKRPLEELILDY